MKYKARIRLITTKKGFKQIQNFLNIIKENDLKRTILNADIFKFYGDIVYLGWDNPPLFKTIESMIICLMAHNVTYRLCVVNKSYDSFQISSNTEPKDRHKNIPNIPVICRFDEKKIDAKLNKFNKNRKGEFNE